MSAAVDGERPRASLIAVMITAGAVVAAVAFRTQAFAQSAAPIVTDRPTQSAGTFVMPPKVFQIEAGYRFTRASEGGEVTDISRFPDALFRLGVVDWAELRLTMSGADITHADASGDVDGSAGFNDISVGAKFPLVDARGARPAFSLLADVTLPVGSDDLTGDFVSPKLLALVGSTFADRWTLTGNVGPVILRDDDRTVADLEYAGALAAAATSEVAVFAEFFGAFALRDTRLHQHTFQTGVTILWGNDVQLDARAGAGLVNGVPDWLFGAGLSWRLFSSNVPLSANASSGMRPRRRTQ